MFIDYRLIGIAREIVRRPMTVLGYSDVGDVLVHYLKGEIDHDQAIEELAFLECDYEELRASSSSSPFER